MVRGMVVENENEQEQQVEDTSLLHPLEMDQILKLSAARHAGTSPTPPPLVGPSLVPFRDYLESWRSSLVRSVVHRAVEQLNLYHPLPVSDVMRTIDTSVRILLDAMIDQRMETVAPRVWERLNMPESQGLTLEQALQLIAISRYECMKLALPALEQHIDGATEGMLFLEQAHDTLVTHISQFYREALHKVNRALLALSHCNEVLVDTDDEEELLRDVCQIIVEKGDYRMVWVAMLDQNRRLQPVAQAGHEYGYLNAIKRLRSDLDQDDDSPVQTAIRTGEPCIVTDIANDPRTIFCQTEALRRGYASVIALPLITNGRTYGSIAIYAGELNAFDTEEVTLLTNLADNLAYGIGALRSREQHRRAEDALKKSEQRFRTLIERNADPIVVLCNGFICFANPAAEVAFGHPLTELLGQEFGIPALIDQKMELDVFDKEGNRTIKEMHAVEIEWENQKAFLATFRDVTVYKHLEATLEQRVRERTVRLLSELEERERTEQAILRHMVILESVQFAAERFLKTNNFQREIPVVLEHLGTATGVSRVVVFTVTIDDAGAVSPHVQGVWLSSVVQDTQDTEDRATLYKSSIGVRFAQWKELLRQGKPVFGDAQAFPAVERSLLEFYTIRSILVVPVFVDQTWWGCLEFDDFQHERSWTLTDVHTLKTAADIMGAAIRRYQVETALRSCEQALHTHEEDTGEKGERNP